MLPILGGSACISNPCLTIMKALCNIREKSEAIAREMILIETTAVVSPAIPGQHSA